MVCRRDNRAQLFGDEKTKSLFVNENMTSGYLVAWKQKTNETPQAFEERRAEWWNSKILAAIYTCNKDYEKGASLSDWFDPVYVAPIIVHKYKVPLVVYNPKNSGASQTSTYAPASIHGDDGVRLTLRNKLCAPAKQSVCIVSNGDERYGHYVNLEPNI